MNVLKDNYNKELSFKENIKKANSYPRFFICQSCLSELEYDRSDIEMGAWGHMHLECPLCGYDNVLEDHEENITLTKDNIEFPIHFYHTSTETGAAHSCNNENVKKCIHEAIDYFRKNKEEYFWGTSFGNLYIHVHRWSGDEVYAVTVTNDFYDIDIPFQAEDY